MFTGIVEELGEVIAVEPLPDQAARLSIRGPLVVSDAGEGDSIAVDGVCLTVVGHGEGVFTADVMAETLSRTTLGALSPGRPVNLERPVTLATRLGGHLVQGHVDGVGMIVARTPSEHWEVVEVSLPAALARYVVEKGSIAVDGVSLIPTTLAATTLGRKQAGDPVNLEVDIIAKHVERLLGERA